MGDANIKAFMTSKSKGEVDIVRQARLKKVAGPSLITPKASWLDLVSYFKQWKNLKALIGSTLSWFFLVSHRRPSHTIPTYRYSTSKSEYG